MAVMEHLIDVLMLAAREGITVTEIVIDEVAYAGAVAEQPGARETARSFTFDGPTNPVLVRKGGHRA